MPKLSNILNDSDEIQIPTNAGPITIQYYPSKVTQKMTSQLRAFGKLANKEDADQGELDQALDKIFRLLLGLIESWDLEDEVACGQCEGCNARMAREAEEKRIKEEEDETLKHSTPEELEHIARFSHLEPEEDEECTAKKTVPFPLDADRLNDLPVWLIGEIAEGLTDPNKGAPKRKGKN